MVKSMALVCAAMLTFSTSSFGMHLAGWFAAKTQPSPGAHQAHNNDPMNSDAARRYRSCQQTSWRLAMTVR